MTVRFAGTLDRRCVSRAAATVSTLVSRPEVTQAWTRESSCAGMTVGGLTRHLIGQPVTVVTLLAQPPGDVEAGRAETVDLLQHYARAAWVREDLDGETNRSIREAAERQADAGPVAALETLAEARAALGSAIASAPPTAYLPWQGWSLTTDDFLVTRMMEMVVHADDLAASLDLPTPDFGAAVLDPVLRLLTALAVSRHGEAAVLRTLARPQRAPGQVSAF